MSPKTSINTQSLIQRLQEAGVNPTAQRIAIFQYVTCEGNHPTAEEVKAWVDDHFPKISLATVYNTLRTLVEADLLREFKLPHTSKVVYDNNVTKHHHFLDEDSGQLIDIPIEMIDLKPKMKRDFLIKDIHVLVRGKKRSG